MKESVIGVCAEWHRRRGAAQLVTQRKDCAAAALRSVSGILYRLVVPPPPSALRRHDWVPRVIYTQHLSYRQTHSEREYQRKGQSLERQRH